MVLQKVFSLSKKGTGFNKVSKKMVNLIFSVVQAVEW